MAKVYTEEDVNVAVKLVTEAFVHELKDGMDPISILGILLAVARNLEAQANE